VKLNNLKEKNHPIYFIVFFAILGLVFKENLEHTKYAITVLIGIILARAIIDAVTHLVKLIRNYSEDT